MAISSTRGTGGCSRQMPVYRCHKDVSALKIKEITPGQDSDVVTGATITPEEEHYAPFYVDEEYVQKHKPQVGGYYVVYKDGYKSFSPAKAFEDGYTAHGQEADTKARLDVLYTIAVGNRNVPAALSVLDSIASLSEKAT